MAETALARRLDTLEDYMKDLSYQSMRTQMELAQFSKEMRQFKTASERDRKQMNKQWGELANRLGTVLEDIVAPNLPRVARELFGCKTPDFFAIRVKRRFDGETREYDALLACPDLVLINETKTKLQDGHVELILAKLAQFPQIYPEYADRRPLGVLATLYPEPAVIRVATRAGVLVMGMGDETMDVLNPEAVEAQG